MQAPPLSSQLVWDDDFVMVELVSTENEYLCVRLGTNVRCDQSKMNLCSRESFNEFERFPMGAAKRKPYAVTDSIRQYAIKCVARSSKQYLHRRILNVLLLKACYPVASAGRQNKRQSGGGGGGERGTSGKCRGKSFRQKARKII